VSSTDDPHQLARIHSVASSTTRAAKPSCECRLRRVAQTRPSSAARTQVWAGQPSRECDEQCWRVQLARPPKASNWPGTSRTVRDTPSELLYGSPMLRGNVARWVGFCLGWCVAVSTLTGCEERHAAKCQRDCESEGRCTRRGEACVATDAPDCERSTQCKESGRCALASDRCVATTEICKTRPACREAGQCGVASESCAATTQQDCMTTLACKKEGRCSPVAGRCAPAASDCLNSEACVQYGRCSVDGPACVTKSSADCEKSRMCRTNGYCSFAGGRCQVTSRADCEKTDGCRDHGVCEFVADNRKSGMEVIPGCVVGSQTDCQRSTACKEKRYCRLIEGVCGR
jgi:hypothetical protein